MTFERRRLANWLTLGAAYAALYVARYNLSLANEPLSRAYGWSRGEVGAVVSVGFAVYGVAAALNGPLVDRIGGRAAMLAGLAGAAAANLAFGLAGLSGLPPRVLAPVLALVWAVNGYFQSFSALSLVKVNAAWFGLRERGTFSAIFSGVIQCGRAAVVLLAGAVLARGSWPWMFVVPAALAAAAFVACRAIVRDAPSDCGFAADAEPAPAGAVPLRELLARPVVRTIALAQLCTGIVRHGFEQWFPRYLVEVHGLAVDDARFQGSAFAVVAAGIAAAVVAGRVSDRVCGGRRAPVAFAGYALQLGCGALIAGSRDLSVLWIAFVGQAAGITVVHAMLAGTAPMDFGGRAAAATAAGVFDGMHYLGGAVAGAGLGLLVDRAGWGAWAPAMMATSAVGLALMVRVWKVSPAAPAPAPRP